MFKMINPIIYYLAGGLFLVIAAVLIAFCFFFWGKSYNFEIKSGSWKYSLSGRWLLYASIALMVISAGICIMRGYFQDKISNYVFLLGTVFILSLVAVILAIISGASNLSTIIALGGLVLALLFSMLWEGSTISIAMTLVFALLFGIGLYCSYKDKSAEVSLPSWVFWTMLITLLMYIALALSVFLNSNIYKYTYLALFAGIQATVGLCLCLGLFYL